MLEGTPMPARWRRLLIRWLTHTVTVVRRAGTDNYGETAEGAVLRDVPCFIDGSRARIPTPGSQDRQINYSVALLRELALEPEDRLEHGRDRQGHEIFAAATIVQVDPTLHPEYGELVCTALVARM